MWQRPWTPPFFYFHDGNYKWDFDLTLKNTVRRIQFVLFLQIMNSSWHTTWKTEPANSQRLETILWFNRSFHEYKNQVLDAPMPWFILNASCRHICPKCLHIKQLQYCNVSERCASDRHATACASVWPKIPILICTMYSRCGCCASIG